ncbi:MAG: YbaB/EbfC family nucleoid-associated protein [Candidatus Eremiobacteraeota bacterium]|nr:YbaB/EbfC family nucleoid-associated protein [Candidatus Eremiobacteraeota bacterium]MBV8366998.1 YbaB/EbfC family nucleoid-associated protein [Candidatus Eremiobacteraeota bacterium]
MNPNLLRQARQLQAQLQKIQEELGNETVTGTAGSGAVTVTLDGHGQLRAVKIEPSAVDPQDIETLEDLIGIAFKDAQSKATELSRSRMGPLAGGLGIPGF